MIRTHLTKYLSVNWSKPPTLRLELLPPRLFTVQQYLALILLSLLLLVGGYQYFSLLKHISHKTAQIAQQQRAQQRAIKPLKLTPVEDVALQKALHTLDYPWTQPFQLIESASNDHITLLEVHPDIEKRAIKLLVQAIDLTAMFDYAKKLKQSNVVRRVTLNTEETQDDEHQPILFTLTVDW